MCDINKDESEEEEERDKEDLSSFVFFIGITEYKKTVTIQNLNHMIKLFYKKIRRL